MITQNIDRLHRAAGSENVVEVHGSIETSSCTRCGASYGIDEVDALFDADGVARLRAPAAGAVKPDVVLFGELLPEAAMARAQAAGRRRRPDALRRHLARRPPGRRAAAVTLAGGGRLAIVTKGATPYDGDAELKLEGEVDEELDALLARAGAEPAPRSDGSEPDRRPAFAVVDDRARARRRRSSPACAQICFRFGAAAD